MPRSFKNVKRLRFVITLATGTFGSSNNNRITLDGYWAVADIDKAGGQMMPSLKAKIHGVSQSDMNSACTLQWQKNSSMLKNTVQVYAIDGPQETFVFEGNIINAWGDYLAMPDAFLMIQAQGYHAAKLQPVAPLSYKGAVPVATVFGQIAANLGVSFENNGVNAMMSDLYLANTSVEQAKDLAQAAGIDLYFDDGVLAITPRGEPRTTTQIPLISASSGMIGYPTFDGVGVNFRTYFNPAIKFGHQFQIQSDIKQATGLWYAMSISHHLDTQPGGGWGSTVRGNKTGLPIVS
jgi:hypothetical protein